MVSGFWHAINSPHEVNIYVKCSCYVREVKMKLTEKPNAGLTVSWNAGGYGPNYLEKEITRFHYGEHIPSSFSIGYLLGKILICSSCSLIGKKNFTSVNLLQLLAFLGRSPELPDRVSLLLPSIIKRSYSLRRYLNSRFVRFLTWFCRLTGCRLNG